MRAFTHFAESDRRDIEHGLNARKTFKQLAQELKKHPSSIAREVKRHRELRESGGSGHCFNECLHKAGCRKRGL